MLAILSRRGAVARDLDDPRGKLAGDERAKLDLHLEALREVEQRICVPALVTWRAMTESSPSCRASARFSASQRSPARSLPCAQVDVLMSAFAYSGGVVWIG
ncbi:MAG: DUF1552 domain-containing protein [Myxococcales bacterium]|nr:DUF1552 domain-containing protein [Myxococcales bacterium]